MNSNLQTLELTQAPAAIAQAKAPWAARLQWPCANWLLLPAGLCATLILVKVVVLVGEIYTFINEVYDRSLI